MRGERVIRAASDGSVMGPALRADPSGVNGGCGTARPCYDFDARPKVAPCSKGQRMSKSLKRVRATLEAAGVTPEIRETALARTAVDAATALGCAVDQIAKSIVLRGENSGAALLFITAGAQ